MVKPPHTPVFQNKTIFLDTPSLALVIPTINPIRIAPITLVIKVKKGNSVFKGIRLMAYRAMARLPFLNVHSHHQFVLPYSHILTYVSATQNVFKYTQTHREIKVLADTFYCFDVYALAIVNNTLLTSSCTLHSRKFLR